MESDADILYQDHLRVQDNNGSLTVTLPQPTPEIIGVEAGDIVVCRVSESKVSYTVHSASSAGDTA